MATGLEKISVRSVSKKGNAKECSYYHTIALISHTSKVTLTAFQARLQQYVNQELPDIQARFRKGRETREQLANICWAIVKATEFQEIICFIAEKEMATHSSVLAWRIPGMGEPDGLPFMGSHRVGHN